MLYFLDGESAGVMNLNEIQKASQEQFARQSHRYGQGRILDNL